MRQRIALMAALFAASALLCSPASADTYSSGLYTQFDVGAITFIGPTASYAATGPSMGVRVGYDLFRWLSIGGYVSGSTHQATLPPPPEGEYFQLYQAGGDGQVRARFGPIGAFAHGGVGIVAISTNVLDRVGVTGSSRGYIGPAFFAGGGFDYRIQGRHFSIGLAGDYALYPLFGAAQTLGVHIFLRYTK